jgi:hypothetical protein
MYHIIFGHGVKCKKVKLTSRAQCMMGFYKKNRTADRFVTLQVVWPVSRVCKMCDLSAHTGQVVWPTVSFTRLLVIGCERIGTSRFHCEKQLNKHVSSSLWCRGGNCTNHLFLLSQLHKTFIFYIFCRKHLLLLSQLHTTPTLSVMC